MKTIPKFIMTRLSSTLLMYPLPSCNRKIMDKIKYLSPQYRADIQRRGSILTWIVILSVYCADVIAEVKEIQKGSVQSHI